MPPTPTRSSYDLRPSPRFYVTGLACLFLLAACLPGLLQPTAHAATTFTVNSNGDGADSNTADGVCNDGGGACTLRAAIQQANATPGADTINIIATGTINLSGKLPDISTVMTISGPGAGLLTVRRDTGGNYRIFTVLAGATVGISGITVTNGRTADGTPSPTFAGRGEGGGGVSNAGTLTLTGCRINGNATGNGGVGGGGASNGYGGSGGYGGGVYNTGTLTMTDCSVTSNRTGDGGVGSYSNGGGGGGGGISSSTGALTLVNCVISGNNTGTGPAAGGGSGGGTGGSGGGVYTDAGTLNINGSVVSENVTGGGVGGGGGGGFGGGIYYGGTTVQGTASVLTNVTVRDNRTGDGSLIGTTQGGFGGGIFNGGSMKLRGVTVSGNVTGTSSNIGGGVGGGIDNSGTMELINATISGNSTTGPGGTGAGLWNAGFANLINCTVAFNTSAAGFGGPGIHVYNDLYVVNLRNTVVAKNGRTDGMSVADISGPNFQSMGHNLIGNAEGNTAFVAAGDQTGTNAAPIDPKLGPLADNGGPTLTHALLAGSPALDAGNNARATDSNNVTFTADQRGVGRFGGAGHVVDIGAYEFHPSLEDVADRVTNEDTPLAVVFDVGDGAVGVTSVTAASNNQALVPDAGLSVSGAGSVRTLQITPAANQTGSAQITLSVTYSGGSVSGDTFQLSVAPVNDAPSFTKGADQNVAEDAGPQAVEGWATNISPGPNEASQAVSFIVTGNTNAALFSSAPAVSATGSLTYTTAPNASGSATVTLVVKDNGGTANGGQDTSAAQTFTINVAPVNDPPVAQDQAVTTPEDASRFIFFAATDVENNSLTFSVVSGPSHGTLTGSGSGRSYTPAANYVGPDSFTFKATDSAGGESAPATVNITVTAVNDPPVNTVPGPQATHQNTTLVFSAPNATLISVADIDAGNDPLRITLTATRGLLTLGGTAGLTFTAGDGTDDLTMTFAGTAADLNAALGSLAFKPDAGYSGAASLQINTNDQGSSGAGGARFDSDFISITVRPGTIEFKQSSYAAAEGAGAMSVTVRRTGDTSQTASVAYATDDGSITSVSVPCSTTSGAALDRCDFTKALGRLVFAPGETEKTVRVLVGDDSYVEGMETALIRLSGVIGSNVTLGSRAVATLSITDDALEPASNPIDDSGRFVRQHYHDFLNREPDAEGLAFWTGEIEQCGADAACREVKRINVSAAFFLSIEFQQTGYFVYRLDKVAFGNLTGRPVPLTLSEFLSDTQTISQRLVVGDDGWELLLEGNKRAFTDAFVALSRFTSRYPSGVSPEAYVDALNANAGGVLSQEERDALVADLRGGAKTRAAVLRGVAEHPAVERRESNQAFVLMQYFGYLRRDPNSAPDQDFTGYSFWLGKLNEFNGNYINAEMVRAFISSDEYRKRFGQ